MKILVVGGTGGFGSVIVRYLSEDGHSVVVAGRNRRSGTAFILANPDMTFVELERSRITPEDLAGFDIVVDATGPFQGASLSLPRAAIAAGINYFDIADDRDFIRRVSHLDGESRRAGVRIITGVSSIPTLSGAVALQLAIGMTEVESVEISITASSRAAFGRAVLLSMLEGAGRPITRADGTTGRAMSSPRSLRIHRDGNTVIDRTVLEIDSADHDTLPSMLQGKPSVVFHAGSELAIHNHAIRSIAALVSRSIISTGTRFLPLARMARRLSVGIGNGQSAMQVRVTGKTNAHRITRDWTVLATRNTGPRIPCMAVPAMIRALGEGRVDPGSGPRIEVLSPKEILGRMPVGSISLEIKESRASLYARIMPDFERISPAIRNMHDQRFPVAAHGRASVIRGRSPVALLIARIFGFPPASTDVSIRVIFESLGKAERWTRDFGGVTFSSLLSEQSGGVSERFGPFSFHFRLEEQQGRLRMIPKGWSMLGLPMPSLFMPSGIATEYEKDGRFHFDVPIILPLIGLVVHYRGWLEPDASSFPQKKSIQK